MAGRLNSETCNDHLFIFQSLQNHDIRIYTFQLRHIYRRSFYLPESYRYV